MRGRARLRGRARVRVSRIAHSAIPPSISLHLPPSPSISLHLPASLHISPSRIAHSAMPFKQMENIAAYAGAARRYGVREPDMFVTVRPYP